MADPKTGTNPAIVLPLRYGVSEATLPLSARVDCLPEDVLVDIFFLATAHQRKLTRLGWQSKLFPRRFSIRTLLAITHTCRRWREIAIGFPRLWTNIDIRNWPQYLAFEARSQALPLSMTMVVPSGGLQMHLKPSGSRLIIGPAFNHVRCLQVELQSVDLAPPPGWFLKMEAPNLEALMLSTASWKYALKEEQDLINYPSFEDVPAARPIKLLDTDSPSPLQALALWGMRGWYPLDHFPHLTHLLLSCRYFHANPTLFSFLRNTPAVRFLHLSHLIHLLEEAPPSFVQVPLHCLRSLLVTDSKPDNAVPVFSYLQFPDSVSIRMTAPEFLDDEYFDLRSLAAVRSATDLDIRTDNPFLCEVQFALHGPTSGFWLNSQMQEAHFAHQWVHDQLINFPRHIPLATITSFTLDCPFVNAGALACALELMTALETLRVLLSAPPKDCRERDSRTYLPPSICFQHPPDLGFHWLAISLNPSLDPGRASPEGKVLCPALKTLAVASNMVEENSGLLCLAVGRYEGYVKQFLEARADTDTPIRALTLQPFASLQVHTVPEEDFEYEAKEWYHESGANVELVEDTERKWRETFEPLVERFEWVPPGKYIFGDFAKRDYWDVEGQEKYWRLGYNSRPHFRNPEDPACDGDDSDSETHEGPCDPDDADDDEDEGEGSRSSPMSYD